MELEVWLSDSKKLTGSQSAVAILGGRKGLRRAVVNEMDVDLAIHEGFSWTALEQLKRKLNLTNQGLAFLTATSEKTVERWFQRRDRITAAASDRLYRAAKVVALAEQVLNDPNQAREWLTTPQRGLGDRLPLEFLATEAGTSEVDSLLRRLQFGFYA